jgi:predicted transglutaminase-like cysteine proteinase
MTRFWILLAAGITFSWCAPHLEKWFIIQQTVLWKSDDILSSKYIPLWNQVREPIWWIEFCRTYTNDCNKSFGEVEILIVNTKNWKIIEEINTRVNASIEPLSDEINHWIEEKWDYAENWYGDCEDYVLLKKKKLIEQWFPESSLLITIVRDKNWEWHAVLTIRTNKWDFILDNQTLKIHKWNETWYTYIKIQSQSAPNIWISAKI